VVDNIKQLSLPEIGVELVHPLVPLGGGVVVQVHAHVSQLEPGEAPDLLHFHLFLFLHQLQLSRKVNEANLKNIFPQGFRGLLLPTLFHGSQLLEGQHCLHHGVRLLLLLAMFHCGHQCLQNLQVDFHKILLEECLYVSIQSVFFGAFLILLVQLHITDLFDVFPDLLVLFLEQIGAVGHLVISGVLFQPLVLLHQLLLRLLEPLHDVLSLNLNSLGGLLVGVLCLHVPLALLHNCQRLVRLDASFNAGAVPDHEACRLLSSFHLKEALALLISRGPVVVIA